MKTASDLQVDKIAFQRSFFEIPSVYVIRILILQKKNIANPEKKDIQDMTTPCYTPEE